ncbi:MAG: hypothetical protein K2J63_11115 [Muribaculaceae bacterium]|nr:hypothetical protein [Muribaculaceae bacterium]
MIYPEVDANPEKTFSAINEIIPFPSLMPYAYIPQTLNIDWNHDDLARLDRLNGDLLHCSISKITSD